MQRTLDQIIICQSRYECKSIYIRLQSEDVFISPTIELNFSGQAKCELNQPLAQKYPLSIEIWNYEPHRLLKVWYFQSWEVQAMKNKHMVSDNNWIIYLKNTEKQPQNKQNKQIRSNKSRSCEKDSSKFKLKVNESKLKNNKKKRDEINSILESKKSNKESIKKTLKNTIHYLIKQQSLVNNFEHYGMDEALPKSKTGKCTPAQQQYSSIKNYSTLFSEYGLNMTELANNSLEKNLELTKLDSKKKISKPR